MRSKSSNQLKI